MKLSAQELVELVKERSGGDFRNTTSSIYSYESGRVLLSEEVASKLAPVLCVKTAELLVDDPAPESRPLDNVLLGQSSSSIVESVPAVIDSYEIELTVRIPGSKSPIRLRRWSLSKKENADRFVVEGHGNSSPDKLQLLTSDDEVIPQVRHAVDDRKAVVKIGPAELLAKANQSQLESDEVALILQITEGLTVSELQQFGAVEKDSSHEEPNEERPNETAVKKKSTLSGDVVLELKDFLDGELAEFLVDLWEQNDGNLHLFLTSDRINSLSDEYEKKLVSVLAHLSLKKNHSAARPLAQELINLADSPARRCDAQYLLGRANWYANSIPDAISALQSCIEISDHIGNLAREGQCLVYLARVGADYVDQLDAPPEELIVSAIHIADQTGRKDIEYLAQRAKMILLQREGKYDQAISLANQVLADARTSESRGLPVRNIVDAIRVNLGTWYRRKYTESARRDAEEIYREGIDRGRDDSHAGMCHYLMADLFIDRLMEASREATEAAAKGDEQTSASKAKRAEYFFAMATKHCETAFQMLDGSGDLEALHKANRRLLLLKDLNYLVPATKQEVVDGLVTMEHKITQMLVGGPTGTGSTYTPGVPVLNLDDLELLLRYVLASRHQNPTKDSGTSTISLNDYLQPGTALCIAWCVADVMVARVFHLSTDGKHVRNRGWFTIPQFTTRLRPEMARMLDSDASTVQHRNRLLDKVQEEVDTIQPVATGSDQRDRTFADLVLIAPQDNLDWACCPLEWLTTDSLEVGEPCEPLLELTDGAVLHATALSSPFAARNVALEPDEFTILATNQSIPTQANGSRSIFDLVSHEVQGVQSLPPTGWKAETLGLMVFGHSDETDALQRRILSWDLTAVKAVVLLFCSSAHYRITRGPFADGLTMQLRRHLGNRGVIVGSRIPVSMSEALRLQRTILTESTRDVPIAQIVTQYMKNSENKNPFETPWVIL